MSAFRAKRTCSAPAKMPANDPKRTLIVPAKKEPPPVTCGERPWSPWRNYCTLGETRRVRCDGRHELNNILGKPRSAANKQKLSEEISELHQCGLKSGHRTDVALGLFGWRRCQLRAVRMYCSARPVRQTPRATTHPPSANKGSMLRATYKIADPITIRTASIFPVHPRMYPSSAGSCLSSARRVRRSVIAGHRQCECNATRQANCRAVKHRVKKDKPATSKPIMAASA